MEIKFRAWDKKRKMMLRDYKQLYNIYLDLNGNIKVHQYLSAMDFETSHNNRFELMRYTGLKDKNGKEIYEGDILKSEYTSIGIPKEKNCHPVFWGNGRWNCDHSINNCCKPWRGDLNDHHLSEEIIGNIYENPDLIKP